MHREVRHNLNWKARVGNCLGFSCIFIFFIPFYCQAANITIGVIADTHVDVTDPAPSNPFGDVPGKRLPGHEDQSIPLAITAFNIAGVDFTIHLGDIVNGPVNNNSARATNYQEYVDYIDGTKVTNDALTDDILHAFGHWDLEPSGGVDADADDYTAIYDSTEGIGSILPSTLVVENLWWPIVAPDNTAMAYTVDTGGFRIVVLSAILNEVEMGTAGQRTGPVVATQQEWFDDVALNTALPVIVIIHQPLVSIRGQGEVTDATTAITSLEALTIKPIVLQGHVHKDSNIILQNGIYYISLKADVWGLDENDTTRFSYSIIEIDNPVHTNNTAGVFKLTGAGHQETRDFSTLLISQYKLNETTGASGTGSIIDSQGFSNGDPCNAVVSVNGPIDGRAITFNGTTDMISNSDVQVSDFPCSFTAWIKTTMTASAQRVPIIYVENGAGTQRFIGLGLNQTTTLPQAIVKPTNPSEETIATTAVNDNKWHHLAAVFESSAVRHIYVDGLLETSEVAGTKAFPSSTDGWVIAKITTGSQTVFNGDMDDVRIYAGALSATQIKTIFDEGNPTGRLDRTDRINQRDSRNRIEIN